ncbi:alpha/beta fold hydrolase [Nocardia altamirensis]|uniref:alpha/beta fold hydrolase n=1 Tax=Nocardia altamirensis TaxID=472158 RepID=UPI0008402F63|nr:alpha/beta hydrolase [Nocardia altamirensis]
MQATSGPLRAGLLSQVRDRLRVHRAHLRTREYATTALNPPATPGVDIPVTAADGTRLSVLAYGPADGEVIVFVHGWTCSLEYWNPQINAFAGSYRVIAYHLRGHGDSELGRSPLTTDLLADDLNVVLDATLRPAQRAVLVGHSLGGAAIQAWAARYPGQVPKRAAAALLTNTPIGNIIGETTLVPLFNRLLPLPRWLGRLGLRFPFMFPPIAPMTWVIRHRFTSADATADIVNFSMAIMRSCPAMVRAKFGALVADLDLGRAAAELTIPTTLIAGAHDRLIPVIHAERIAEILTEAGSLEKLEILPTGHLSSVEAFEQFNDELAKILTAVYGPAQPAPSYPPQLPSETGSGRAR